MASSSSDDHRYEVFLSFRGKDTRNNFSSHLFAALKHHGFTVFHDTMLHRGQNVSSGLLAAIEDSKLSIVVFSRNYADSRWCLDELVKIMDCHRRSSHQQIVLPLFYDVEPSDVRNQKGQYAAAFTNHHNNQKIEKVRKWKAALNEAGELSGSHLQNDSNGDEADFISKIVKEVEARLDKHYLNVACHPVGIESHVEKLKGLLSLETNDIHIIAICGVGGIGKTTIAKALFNEICRLFDGSCFLADVRAIAARPDDVGMIILQERLIADVIKENILKIYSCDRGIEVIKQRLWCRRVLIVLDDVDNSRQLKKLAINRSWLRRGSIVIITTRDKSCVSPLDVKYYEPAPLEPSNSLKLFSWHAFGENCPKTGYKALSHEIVKYTGGLPLVLETLGPYMRNFGTKEEWQEALKRLTIIPHGDVQAKLKLSFDSLAPKEKQLFLDIACFFVGTDKELMLQVLDEKAPEYYPKFEFKVLCNRCLVKIDRFSKLSMHDVVRDMGREIVRQEFENDPGRRSRLCHPHDVLSVFKKSSGTEAIETIFLEVSNLYEELVDVKAFAKMNRLRMIHFSNINLHGTCSSMRFLEKLKWLWWYSFPFTCIPSNMDMRDLVVLDLQNSKLKQLWLGTKDLDQLRFLNVSHSHILTSTPDFRRVLNLEKLLLRDCTNLREIHQSIGCLQKLVVLDLGNCKSLSKVPSSFLQLKALEDLNLSGCSKLFEPVGFEASVSGLWQWFSSRLPWKPQPRSLEPSFLLPNSVHGQSFLTKLNLENCNLSCLPTAMGSLVSLEILLLNGNKFASLPASVTYLKCLQRLDVEDCVELQSLQDLPSGITTVLAENCPLLETIQFASDRNGQTNLIVSRNTKLIDNIFTNKGHFLSKFDLNVNGNKEDIPYWFSYQGVGPFISFVVPQRTDRSRIKGWIAAVLVDSSIDHLDFIIGNVFNKTKDVLSVFVRMADGDNLWMGYVDFSKHGITADGGDEIEIVFLGNTRVKKCGLCLVYDGDEDFEVDGEQLLIQYSPNIHLYDEDEDEGDDDEQLVIDDDEDDDGSGYISSVMLARVKSMLHDLTDNEVDLRKPLKELVVAGGSIHGISEHRLVYRILINAVYTQFLEPCGGVRSTFLKALEEDLG